jgi:hypothetical protein
MEGLSIIYQPSATPYLCALLVVPITVSDTSGCAHVLEHLIFHSGERKGVGLTDLGSASGTVYLDAVTSRRCTLYRLAATTEPLFERLLLRLFESAWCPELSERAFSEQAWRIELCDNKLRYNGVVYNETVAAYRDPNRRAWESICSLLHDGRPGQFDAGGTPAGIVRLQLRDVEEAHREWYRPARCVLLLTGPVEFDRLLRKLSKVRDGKSVGVSESSTSLPFNGRTALKVVPSVPGWPVAGWRLGLVSDQFDLAEAQLLNLVLVDRMRSALPTVFGRASGARLWSRTGLYTSFKELTWVVGIESPDAAPSFRFDSNELVAFVRQCANVVGEPYAQKRWLRQLLDRWRLSQELTAQFSPLPDGLTFLSKAVPFVLDDQRSFRPILDCQAAQQELQQRIDEDRYYLQHLFVRLVLDNHRSVAIDHANDSSPGEPLPPPSSKPSKPTAAERLSRCGPVVVSSTPRGAALRRAPLAAQFRPGLWMGTLPDTPLAALRLLLEGKVESSADSGWDGEYALAAEAGASFAGQRLSASTFAVQQHGPRVQLFVRQNESGLVIEPILSFECLSKHFGAMLRAVRTFFPTGDHIAADQEIEARLARRLLAELARLRQQSHQQALMAAGAVFSARCAWTDAATGLGMIFASDDLLKRRQASSVYGTFRETVRTCDFLVADRAAALLLAPAKDLGKNAALFTAAIPVKLAPRAQPCDAKWFNPVDAGKRALLIPSAVTSFARAYPVSGANTRERAALSILAKLLDRAVRQIARTKRGAYLAGAVYDPRASLFGVFASGQVALDKALSDFERAVQEVEEAVQRLQPREINCLSDQLRLPTTHPFTALGRCESNFLDWAHQGALGTALGDHSLGAGNDYLLDCSQRFLSGEPSDVAVGDPETIVPSLASDWSVREFGSRNSSTRDRPNGMSQSKDPGRITAVGIA